MRVIVVGYGVMGKKVCKAVNEDETLTLAAVVSPVLIKHQKFLIIQISMM